MFGTIYVLNNCVGRLKLEKMMEMALDQNSIFQLRTRRTEKVDKIKIVLIDSILDDFVSLKKIFQTSDKIFAEWNYFPRLYEATQWLNLHKTDVILVDIWLPDGFGRDTIYTLQTISPETPVIVLTDREDKEIALNLLADGAQGCLIKQFGDPRAVIQTIARAVKNQTVIV